jgi:hypothetical protein
VPQARSAIDFYEVVFVDNTAPDRVFSASAIKTGVLTLQLPAGKTYKTVLLAGSYTSGTLLAWAYHAAFEVTTSTREIPYELMALDAAVNGGTNKVAFTDPDLSEPDGTAKDGSPYFLLDTNFAAAGSITVGNFPVAAVFDTALNDNNQADFQAVLEPLAKLAAVNDFNPVAAYAYAYDYLDEARMFEANLLNDNHEITKEEMLAELGRKRDCFTAATETLAIVQQIVELEPLVSAAKTAVAAAAAVDYANPAAKTAWNTANTAFTPLTFSASDKWSTLETTIQLMVDTVNEYIEELTTILGDDSKFPFDVDNFTKRLPMVDAGNALWGAHDAVALPDVDVDAFASAIASAQKAITATTSFFSSLGLESDGGLIGVDPITPAFLGGYVTAPASSGSPGTLNFFLTTPSKNGLTKLYYDIPFKAFGRSAQKQWHIKQGLENYLVDNGENNGGSILLSIGSVPSDDLIAIPIGPGN